MTNRGISALIIAIPLCIFFMDTNAMWQATRWWWGKLPFTITRKSPPSDPPVEAQQIAEWGGQVDPPRRLRQRPQTSCLCGWAVIPELLRIQTQEITKRNGLSYLGAASQAWICVSRPEQAQSVTLTFT